MRFRWALVAVAPLCACGLDLAGSATDVSATSPDGSASNGEGGPNDGTEGGTTPQPDGGNDALDTPDANPYNTRVTSGLVGLWELEENGGSTVHDSTTPSPLDLTIDNTGKVTWKPHALEITDYVEITSSGSFAKAKAACTNEFTAEAWVESAKNGENDYARIAWWGDNTNRNLAIGSYLNDTWWSSMHGAEDLLQGSVSTALTHFVATRASNGTLTSYIDGTSVGTRSTSGGFNDYPFTIANVTGGGRGWLGTIHLVAIYCRALSGAEVQTNHAAGADP